MFPLRIVSNLQPRKNIFKKMASLLFEHAAILKDGPFEISDQILFQILSS